MDPNFAYVHLVLRYLYRDLGKYDASLEEWKKYASLNDDKEDLAIADAAAKAYAQSGLKASLTREVEMRKDLAKRRYTDPAEIALVYAQLGDKEQTFIWLNKAISERSAAVESIKVFRALDQWKNDPLYIDAMKKLGMP